jgi:hypothetical protein
MSLLTLRTVGIVRYWSIGGGIGGVPVPDTAGDSRDM